MNNVFIVTYYNSGIFNGVVSYNAFIESAIYNFTQIKIHHIKLNAPNIQKVEKEIKENGTIFINVPKDLVSSGMITPYDVDIVNQIIEIIGITENVVFHFNWINHSFLSPLLKKKMKCKTVLTLHYMYWRDFILADYNLYYKYHSSFADKENLSFVYKRKIWREALCYNCVDYLIAVTNDASMAAQHLFNVPKEKITIIYNGIDIEAIQSKTPKSELRQKYHFPENEKIILFVGRLTKMKGVAELVEAFEKLAAADTAQAYRLLICGKGDYDWLYKHIHHYSQITLTGNLAKEQLYECYALADVGVIPSYAEQCSYTAIEMMAAQLPVVVTNVGGLAELIDSQTGLLVELQFTPEKLVFSTDILAEKIRTSLTETEATALRTQKAYLKAKSTLTAETMATQTLQVYEKLLLPTSAPTPAPSEHLVSVVIPCYNAEKYIKECLESVCSQTYTNIEIIVINDASTDSTAQLLQEIKDDRIKILLNKKNKGVAYSLNKGLAAAKGKYIARIDADDKMMPDRIALQVAFLEQHPAYAMVGSSQILIDEQGNVLQYVAYPETNAEIQAFKYFLNPFSHPTVMMNAAVVKPLGYSTEYPHCEDYALWFRIAEKHPVANLPQYTTLQRLHKHNISKEKSKEQRENAFTLLLDEFDNKGLSLSNNEVKLHSAIFTNKGRTYFNTPEKIETQKQWIHKVLTHFGVDDAALAEAVNEYTIA